MLVAFMLYNDGIGTIIRMATLYGTQVGIDQGSLIAALLLVQFIGVPCAFLFGAVASKVGAKPAILVALVLYTVISVLAFRMTTARDFLVLAGAGRPGAGRQPGAEPLALRQPDPARIGPPSSSASSRCSRSSPGSSGRCCSRRRWRSPGSSRAAILSVILFFVAGGALLVTVDIDEGRRAAER